MCCLVLAGASHCAYAQDTTRHAAAGDSSTKRSMLTPVSVTGSAAPRPTLTQAPTQVIGAERLEQSGATVVSDAVKQMAGVSLRDYGGVGGMKTVSSRGLGSQFSTLTIDGVPVNDAQNGQVDLGRYLTGNSEYISLTNGMGTSLLQTARAAAAGSVINMETQQPALYNNRPRLSLGLEGGSFGYLSPTLHWDQRIRQDLTLSFYGNYTRSNGDYPFTLYYTTSHDGNSSREHREHSDMWMATGDLNVTWRPGEGQRLRTKIHYVRGFHNLPGPVVFYAKRGSEDTKEQLFFTQVQYSHTGAEHWKWQLVGKYQNSWDLYEDHHANTLTHYMMNEYRQNEGYLSGTAVWEPTTHWSVALATDGAVTTLESNLANNNEVERFSSLTTLTAQYSHRLFDLNANMLATIIEEHANSKEAPVTYQKLSPYLGLNTKALLGKVRLRYFYKETYRVPNFNEMYYFTLTRDLKPERAEQHNLGLTLPTMAVLQRSDSNGLAHNLLSCSLTADGYLNRVHDKIIAVPTQNMFLWSMENLGLVSITGVDVTANCEAALGATTLTLTAIYTYQRALDITDPNSKTYKNQIVYTPRHSGNVSLYWKSPWLNVGYTAMLVGVRYYKQQNMPESMLPRYADQGITADRKFALRHGTLLAQVQLLNIFDVQYEVVRSYPMMGRNLRLKLVYTI
ncbi:MAG: TonB-dependent receptor [Bacteroidales bacterium]|nr:TonB-dependent receptor [Bacteroidales bacterium]